MVLSLTMLTRSTRFKNSLIFKNSVENYNAIKGLDKFESSSDHGGWLTCKGVRREEHTFLEHRHEKYPMLLASSVCQSFLTTE